MCQLPVDLAAANILLFIIQEPKIKEASDIRQTCFQTLKLRLQGTEDMGRAPGFQALEDTNHRKEVTESQEINGLVQGGPATSPQPRRGG